MTESVLFSLDIHVLNVPLLHEDGVMKYAFEDGVMKYEKRIVEMYHTRTEVETSDRILTEFKKLHQG